MEVFDVGEKTVDEAIDALLHESRLSSLVRRSGAACFALVRSALAPFFYHRLIGTSADIDATLRHHVAFIVFYGSRASFVRPQHSRSQGYFGRYRINGLSTSSETEHDRTFRPLPARLWSSHPSDEPSGDVQFSGVYKETFRFEPEAVNAHLLEHHMARATNALMNRFGVAEHQLPCMLVVDPSDLSRYLLVQLDRRDSLTSLHTHVLQPLSQELRDFEALITVRRELNETKSRLSLAATVCGSLPTTLAQHEVALVEGQQQSERLQAAMEAELNKWSTLRGYLLDSFDEADVLIRDSPTSELVMKRLTFALHCRDRADQMQAAAMSLRSKSPGTPRERSLLRGVAIMTRRRQRKLRQLQRHVDARIAELELPLISLRARCKDMERKASECRATLSAASTFIARHSPEVVASETEKMRRHVESLRERGHDDPILFGDDSTHFSAFDVIRRLTERRLCGVWQDADDPDRGTQFAPLSPRLVDLPRPPWDHPAMEQLLKSLVDAYSEMHAAGFLALTAGVSIESWVRQQAPLFGWIDLITLTMAQGKLRRLLDRAIKDAAVAAYHSQFRAFLNA